jgi:phosphatidylglycerophosphate synthase
VFDGVVARRLNVATATLRRLDSIADSVFYFAALFAASYLHPQALHEHIAALLVLAALEIGRYVFDLVKFRREASYHMWSSKLWGICLFVGCFALLALDMSGVPVAIAIYIGNVADLEGLAISVILAEWKTDVPPFMHALRSRGTST